MPTAGCFLFANGRREYHAGNPMDIIALLPTILVVLAVAGTLFSGYMSGVRFFTKTCAFHESCPIFLGQPACFYGFGMFIALLVLTVLARVNPTLAPVLLLWIMGVSVTGILFAGCYTVGEVARWARGKAKYALALPTCSYGLIFYALILGIAWKLAA